MGEVLRPGSCAHRGEGANSVRAGVATPHPDQEVYSALARPIEATSNKRDIYRGRNTDTPRPSVHWATDHGRTAASITHTRTLIGLAQGQHSTVSRSLSIRIFQRELPHIDRGMRTFMYTP